MVDWKAILYLVIPKDFAKEYGLDEPSHVVVEGTSEGILIRKLMM